MCHDPDRHVTILFGGAGGTDSRSLLGDTWTWDGTTWTHRNVPGPSPRMSCAMVFDSARHVAVLFGGVTQFNGPNIEPSGETWEWDGDAWTQRFVPGPEPRGSHAMVYDSRRRRTILHGGFTGTDAPNFMPANDTWEWNGVNWSRRLLRVSPILARHAMAFDSFRGVTVVHGGTTTAYSDSYETWELALACPADFNLDGNIDFFDYDDYVSCFEGTSCPPSTNADFNADGSIDFFDYDDFVAAFEAGC